MVVSLVRYRRASGGSAAQVSKLLDQLLALDWRFKALCLSDDPSAFSVNSRLLKFEFFELALVLFLGLGFQPPQRLDRFPQHRTFEYSRSAYGYAPEVWYYVPVVAAFWPDGESAPQGGTQRDNGANGNEIERRLRAVGNIDQPRS